MISEQFLGGTVDGASCLNLSSYDAELENYCDLQLPLLCIQILALRLADIRPLLSVHLMAPAGSLWRRNHSDFGSSFFSKINRFIFITELPEWAHQIRDEIVSCVGYIYGDVRRKENKINGHRLLFAKSNRKELLGRVFFFKLPSFCVLGGLISLWLYEENNKVREWKNIFTLHILPWAPHTYVFVVLTSLTHPRKIIFVVLQIGK
jgi:hypothetical protein